MDASRLRRPAKELTRRRDRRALPGPCRTLHDALARSLPLDRLVRDPLRAPALGTDASFYRLVRRVVVRDEHADEVAPVLRASAHRLSAPSPRSAIAPPPGAARASPHELRTGGRPPRPPSRSPRNDRGTRT